jgi:hypothetical protein
MFLNLVVKKHLAVKEANAVAILDLELILRPSMSELGFFYIQTV